MNRRRFLSSVSAAALLAALPLPLVMGRAAKATLPPGDLAFKVIEPGTPYFMESHSYLPPGQTSLKEYITRKYLAQGWENPEIVWIRHDPRDSAAFLARRKASPPAARATPRGSR